MTIYYHSESRGFYDTQVHGERTVKVIDLDWQRSVGIDDDPSNATSGVSSEPPLLDVLNPQCMLPAEQELIEISQSDYDRLLAAQSRGEIITVENGKPVAIVPALNEADRTEAERLWRDEAMAAVLWLRERHRDELELERPTTLSREQFNSLLDYLQLLRDWPQSDSFPDAARRPSSPSWLSQEQQ